MNKGLENLLCNMDKERLNLFAKTVVHISLLVLKANGDIEEVIAGRDIWDFKIDDELLSASKLWFDEVKSNEPFKDIFSEFYEVEYQEKGRNINGFFATPPDISYLIGSLYGEVEDKAYEKSFDDFCCGAGVFALQSFSIKPFRNYYLNDKDSFMCAVSAMQILSNIATFRIYPKALFITNENALLNERIPFLTVKFNYQTIIKERNA